MEQIKHDLEIRELYDTDRSYRFSFYLTSYKELQVLVSHDTKKFENAD